MPLLRELRRENGNRRAQFAPCRRLPGGKLLNCLAPLMLQLCSGLQPDCVVSRDVSDGRADRVVTVRTMGIIENVVFDCDVNRGLQSVCEQMDSDLLIWAYSGEDTVSSALTSVPLNQYPHESGRIPISIFRPKLNRLAAIMNVVVANGHVFPEDFAAAWVAALRTPGDVVDMRDLVILDCPTSHIRPVFDPVAIAYVAGKISQPRAADVVNQAIMHTYIRPTSANATSTRSGDVDIADIVTALLAVHDSAANTIGVTIRRRFDVRGDSCRVGWSSDVKRTTRNVAKKIPIVVQIGQIKFERGSYDIVYDQEADVRVAGIRISVMRIRRTEVDHPNTISVLLPTSWAIQKFVHRKDGPWPCAIRANPTSKRQVKLTVESVAAPEQERGPIGG